MLQGNRLGELGVSSLKKRRFKGDLPVLKGAPRKLERDLGQGGMAFQCHKVEID